MESLDSHGMQKHIDAKRSSNTLPLHLRSPKRLTNAKALILNDSLFRRDSQFRIARILNAIILLWCDGNNLDAKCVGRRLPDLRESARPLRFRACVLCVVS